jgi:uncharacterized repeat protein (TIGR03943 family)
VSRETENVLLLLVGLCTGIITVTGAYTRYVKPALLPWLGASAALLLILALTAIVRDVRRGRPDAHPHDDVHRGGVGWLLLLPIGLLGFAVPPAITPQAAAPTVTSVSSDVLRRPFPPLPPGRAPEVGLTDLLLRVNQDTAGTLDGRLISVSGFTMRDGDRIDIARVVIVCCAADAQLARVHVDGPAAARLAEMPENTWVRVEGEVPAGQGDSTGLAIPVLNAAHASPTAPPKRPYAD